jgi:hypothetical protein
MGDSSYLRELQSRHAQRDFSERPFFISERNWAIFAGYLSNQAAIPDLARLHRFSVRRVRQILRDVDHQLGLPRNSGREWRQVTANSPVDDLAISVRALNQLRDLGCATVEDVLRLDFGQKIMGHASRVEVLEALGRCGFAAATAALPQSNGDLLRVSEQLRDLRDRIDENLRSWRQRVDGIEARLRRLS